MRQEELNAEQRTERLRRRLWRERAVFAGVVALGLAYYYYALQGGSACLIAVDGKPAVVVRNRVVAQRVLNEIRGRARDIRGVTFLQKVTLHRVSAEDNKITSDVAALQALSPKLTLVVPGAGVFANGRLLFGLPNQEEAVSTLSQLLKELSPPDPGLTRVFREEVRVRAAPIPVNLFLPSAEAALEQLRQLSEPQGTHTVTRGETAWKIAEQYRVSLQRLAAANPKVNLHLLRVDDRLAIPGPGPPLTVVAWKEIQEPITTGAQAGKFLTVRIVYENGAQTERTVIRRPARTEPKPLPPRRASTRGRSRPHPPRKSPPQVEPRPITPAAVTAQVPQEPREETPAPAPNLSPEPREPSPEQIPPQLESLP